MTGRKKETPARKKATARRKKATAIRSKTGGGKSDIPKSSVVPDSPESGAISSSFHTLEQQLTALFGSFSDLTSNAMKRVSDTWEGAVKSKERAFSNKGSESSKLSGPDRLRKMADAGESLRDLRQVAGLTVSDISKALNLKDKSVIEAVEDGKEALSLEMIMRLASLYARNDPIPFVVKYIRTYWPKLWAAMEGLGLDGIPVKIERERRFLNIYKRRDAARQLSSEGFDKVLAFTQDAFELALHFIAELEQIENKLNPEFEDIHLKQDAQDKA